MLVRAHVAEVLLRRDIRRGARAPAARGHRLSEHFQREVPLAGPRGGAGRAFHVAIGGARWSSGG